MKNKDDLVYASTFVKGIELAKKAETLLWIYTLLHIIGSAALAYLNSQELVAKTWSDNVEFTTNWTSFAIIFGVGLGIAVVIFTVCSLLIQMYANIVATREVTYMYVNRQLKKDSKPNNELNQ